MVQHMCILLHSGPSVTQTMGKDCSERSNGRLPYFAQMWLGICWNGLHLRQPGSVGEQQLQGKQLC